MEEEATSGLNDCLQTLADTFAGRGDVGVNQWLHPLANKFAGRGDVGVK